jgi:peptidoglycan/xylan/chitin deacetylase (PgdA/CDA1 family)/GT2 family glycosyltransferase
VIDGSTDGTADALETMSAPFKLIILKQSNKGRAVACNTGVTAASGEILLFLDDDMEAHPSLLSAHDSSHQDGADVVLGHMPLHPESPPSILIDAVKEWADQRCRKLSLPNLEIPLHDLQTGQMSIASLLFREIGGFDTSFTDSGTFGNEDIDFGYRLMMRGCRITFNPNAISWQKYIVKPQTYLLRAREVGHADVLFSRKHPEKAQTIFKSRGAGRPVHRLCRWIIALPLLGNLLSKAKYMFAVYFLSKDYTGTFTTTIFKAARVMQYWQGVREAGGIPNRNSIRILAYHAISDLKGFEILEPYGVRPESFRQQLNTLKKAGYVFITPDEFSRFLTGKDGLPQKALLLTFDDCYKDLLDNALPILEEQRVAALAFAVTGCLGGTNRWDKAIGAPQIELMSEEELKQVADSGIEIGSHSQTHPKMHKIERSQQIQEIVGSIDDLESLGLKKPRYFSYPHGCYDRHSQNVLRNAKIEAAFTVKPRFFKYGQNPMEIPRIEILRKDVGWKLLWKVIIAPRFHFRMF